MNRDEVKLVFDNKDDRDKVADNYGSFGNDVYDNCAPIDKEDHPNDDKYSMTIQRDAIEDWERVGQDAKLYGADIETSVD